MLGVDYSHDLSWLLNEERQEREDPWRFAERPRTLTTINSLLPKRDSEASTIHPFELLAEYVMRTASAQRASVVAVCKYKGYRYMQLPDGKSFAERDGSVWIKRDDRG